MRKILLLLTVLIILTPLVPADSVRGPVAGIISLSDEPKPIQVSLEDLIVITAPENPDLLLGIEIEIKIPPAVREFRDSFAFYLYRKPSPYPSRDNRNYTALRTAFEVLPSSIRAFYQIPVRAEHGLKDSLGTTVISRIVPPEEFPLLITILPVMKGIPSHVMASTFELTARPVLAPFGNLVLIISPEDNPEYPFKVFINDKPINFTSRPIPLKTGFHYIRIESEDYREKRFTVTIEKGATTEIVYKPEPLVPSLIIDYPKGTQVFLNGQKYSAPPGSSLEVAEGPHTILFRLGDHSLSKSFTAEKGKTYNITLFLDILIQDN